MNLIPSGSQTVGPFFNFALTSNPALGVLARPAAQGVRIKLKFQVIDGEGIPTPGDSMVELWQADSHGSYKSTDPEFCGFGRLETDVNGECVFETVKPGSVADGQAPHIHVTLFARGLLKHLYTRVYFAAEPANDADSLLALVPEPRRRTLLAQNTDGNEWLFPIRLQGENETVFFEM